MRKLVTILFSVFVTAGCSGGAIGNFSADDYVADYVTRERSIGSAITADNKGIKVDGVTYRLSDEATKLSDLKYEITDDDDSRQVLFAIKGDNVRAMMINHDVLGTSKGDFSRYGAVGSMTYPSPDKTLRFQGTYYTADTGQEWVEVKERDIEMRVDFGKGVLRGNSLGVSGSDYVEINGIISRSGVELMINDETENSHRGEGGFFGKDATEFLGGYQEDNRLGLIYANH